MKHRRKSESHEKDSRREASSLSFAGWQDYHQWADHDFLPKRRFPVAPAAPVETPAEVFIEDDEWETEDLGEVYQSASGVLPELSLNSPAGEAGHGFAALRMVPGRADSHPIPENAYLRFETLVSTARPATEPWGDDALNWQHQAICELCRSPRSVAEVSAYISAPLEITRLLISYAVTLGFLVVHDADSTEDMRPTIELLRRVHHGLRRLA